MNKLFTFAIKCTDGTILLDCAQSDTLENARFKRSNSLNDQWRIMDEVQEASEVAEFCKTVLSEVMPHDLPERKHESWNRYNDMAHEVLNRLHVDTPKEEPIMTIYQTLQQKITDQYENGTQEVSGLFSPVRMSYKNYQKELSKLAALYVFQMSEADRLHIRKELSAHLQAEGLEGTELQEAIELGMDSKLSDLSI